MDQLQRAAVAAFQRLRRLAPAAIEDRIRVTRAAAVAASEDMMPTRTLIAVRVWPRAIERISVTALGHPDFLRGERNECAVQVDECS